MTSSERIANFNLHQIVTMKFQVSIMSKVNLPGTIVLVKGYGGRAEKMVVRSVDSDTVEVSRPGEKESIYLPQRMVFAFDDSIERRANEAIEAAESAWNDAHAFDCKLPTTSAKSTQ